MNSMTITFAPTRRDVLKIAGATLAISDAAGTAALAQPKAGESKVKAIGFDAFTIFDPSSIEAAVEDIFPGKGKELAAGWRARLFEYTWLRTLNRTYVDFRQVSEDALNFVFKAAKIELKPNVRETLLNAFAHLRPYPDSVEALKAMRQGGIRLAYVSDLTPVLLKTITANARATDLFEYFLSTDAVQAFKPDPRAYQMAEMAFGLPRETIVFAAFGGWDAAGAKSFGLRTFWVNRFNAPLEELGVRPDASGETLVELANYAMA
jgi:2-haloacid dehalogenase